MSTNKSVFVLLLLFLLFAGRMSIAQTCSDASCTADTYTVDLSAAPEGIWVSPSSTGRNGVCCGNTGTRCIKFIVIPNALSTQFSWDITGGPKPGGQKYQVDCGTPISAGTSLCKNGASGSFCIVYCKPGGDKGEYTITASRSVGNSGNISLRPGCSSTISVSGFNPAGLTWTSIYPGAAGAYNSYLSCSTNCYNPVVTAPPSGAPAYIDYQATGTVLGCNSGSPTTETIRVYFTGQITATFSPATPTVCFGGTTTPVTVTASGASAPYTYLWDSPAVTTATANLGAGNHTVTIKDSASNCNGISFPITVTQFTSPITANAGPVQNVCVGSPSVTLAGSVQAASGGIWSGGSGTYVPNNTTLNATYTPSATEITNGVANLTLTTTGNGTCSSASSNTSINIYPNPTLNLSKVDVCGSATTGQIRFNNSVASLNYGFSSGATYTGGTPSTSAIFGTNVITGLSAGVYTVRLQNSSTNCYTDKTITISSNPNLH